jgi:hypothetical protein
LEEFRIITILYYSQKAKELLEKAKREVEEFIEGK